MVMDKECSAANPLEELTRKWALVVIKDLFLGARRFNDFLEMNPGISGKVLSDQLKRLGEQGYVEKRVVSTTPLRAEYHLTEKGRDLNKVLYEMMVYARRYWSPVDEDPFLEENNLRKVFGT